MNRCEICDSKENLVLIHSGVACGNCINTAFVEFRRQKKDLGAEIDQQRT